MGRFVVAGSSWPRSWAIALLTALAYAAVAAAALMLAGPPATTRSTVVSELSLMPAGTAVDEKTCPDAETAIPANATNPANPTLSFMLSPFLVRFLTLCPK